MFKPPFGHQKKQKLLNYEIRVIEECQDSLFTEGDCEHQRYLSWGLAESLAQLLHGYRYSLRWIGNDPQAYISAYFYVVIVGCSAHPHFMVELKSVLYELAEKYLAQFEQKLLIEFLCLIEYSQQRYVFFRKYSKIESILLKLFSQIEERNAPPVQEQHLQSQEDSRVGKAVFSKLTTCITSPCKSKQEEPRFALRNSDYNQVLKQREYRREVQQPVRLSKQTRTSHFRWYEIYNQYFYFVNMNPLNENNVKININLPPITDHPSEEFVITVEKGCFFVVELALLDRKLSPEDEKNCSFLEESKEYLAKLIEKEMTDSQAKRESNGFSSAKSRQEFNLQFTPKFLSNRKKLSLADKDFYNDEVVNKKVEIEVLDIHEFNTDEPRPSVHPDREKQMERYRLIERERQTERQRQNEREMQKEREKKLERSYHHPLSMKQESVTSILQYKNKIDKLGSLNSTIKSIDLEKNAMKEEIRSHPLFEEFRQNHNLDSSKNLRLQQQHYPSHVQFDQKRLAGSKHPKMNELGQQNRKNGVNHFIDKTVKGPSFKSNRNTVYDPHAHALHHDATLRNNPEKRDVRIKVYQTPPNEINLSAQNIKKRYPQPLVQSGRKLISPFPKQFHSHSPRNRLLEERPTTSYQYAFFSPGRLPINSKIMLLRREEPNKIKFTYS